MADEPELHVVRFPQDPDRQAERERQRAESRRRHEGRLALALVELGLDAGLASGWSAAVLDRVFVVTRAEGGEPCRCTCHPQLPETDLHDHGDACSCRLSAAEARQRWDDWQAELDAHRASPEGVAARRRYEAERDAVDSWVAGEDGVEIDSFGGVAPGQWSGSVDGRSFFFRERHGQWRLELDLRPSGRVVETADGGTREVEVGDVVAEGVVEHPGYGVTPLERAHFVVRTVRDHLRARDCQEHADPGELGRRLGARAGWCPTCGTPLG